MQKNNLTKGQYQINIVDSNLVKIKEFEKTAEKKYSKEKLTGFSHVRTRDGGFMLQAFFDYKEPCDDCFEFGKTFDFSKINQEGIDPVDLLFDGMVKSIWTGGFIEKEDENGKPE